MSPRPLTLAALRESANDRWVRDWIAGKEAAGFAAAVPLQRYPVQLRTTQGYLTKMPRDWVHRWPELGAMVDSLADLQDRLTDEEIAASPSSAPSPSAPAARTPASQFMPKSSDDYVAVIKGGMQRRSRTHEAIVRDAGGFLHRAGAVVSTPHPVDLLVTEPTTIIIEVKTLRGEHSGRAVREAVGQLLEYRYFLGPRPAELCILLDGPAPPQLVAYVEKELKMLIAWWTDGELRAGPHSATRLPGVSVA